jgi:hypothetical protein
MADFRGAGDGMRTTRSTTVACLGVAALLAGCSTPLPRQESGNPLRTPRMSRDSVGLEIFFVRLPAADRQAYDSIWNEADEQRFGVGLRRQMAENGLRAGVLGWQMPAAVQRLLDEQSQRAVEADGPQQGIQVTELDRTSPIRIRQLQVRPGRRSEIIASSVYESLPLLVREGGVLKGRSYQNCQGILALHAYPEPDGQVRLEVWPELHHGQPRHRFTGSDGVLKLETGRPRDVFEHLRLDVSLSPGEMLLLGGQPDRPGSLGNCFFVDRNAGQAERKLILVRVAATQRDELFAPPER